jgi:ABC-type transport system involved in cytochrome bd biosynthesis fused ATPase/permease subunit
MSPRYQSITLFQRTVHTMFGTLLLLALVYCVVLLSIVFSVIERKQDNIASRDLTSELASLEAKYANTVGGINDSVLAQNNFKRVDGTAFAVRKDPIASYTVLYAH